MNPEKEHKLAILTAISSKDIAQKSWFELCDGRSIDDFDSITSRFLPAIYLNLNRHGLNINAKLRGLFHYNTAKNLCRLRALKNIFLDLNSQKVDYLVLKGMAIILRLNSFGLRVLGDVDLVINKRSLREVTEILLNNGFTNKYAVNCSNFRESTVADKITFINKEKLEVDLHISEYAFPSLLFQEMLAKPYRIIQWENLSIRIPDDISLMKHALVHGKQYSAVTDRWQSILDVSTLKDRLETEGQEISSKLINDEINLLKKSVAHALEMKTNTFPFFLSSLRLQLYFLLNLLLSVRARFYSPTRLRLWITKRSIKFLIKQILYSAWNLLGRSAKLEFIIIKVFGGFLPRPSASFESSLNVLIVAGLNNLVVAQSNYELRLKLKAHSIASKYDFYVHSKYFRNNIFEVFCNGTLIGNTLSNELGDFGVTYFDPTRIVELSIRNPVHSCSKCIPKFEDLTIRLEY